MNEKIKNVFKQKRMIYLGIIVVLVVFAVGLNIAFSAFTATDIAPAANIKVGGMEYQMTINDVDTRIITIPQGASNIPYNIKINAQNDVESKYELYYETCENPDCNQTKANIAGMIIEYSDKNDSITGQIASNGQKEIAIRISNNTDNAITIRLDVNAGFIGNALTFRNLITQKYYNEPILFNEYILSISEIEEENGKRFQGDIANNFVTFNNELWRIVGVFNDDVHGVDGESLVKLVRHEPIDNYDWDNQAGNDWESSTLRLLLNMNYYLGVDENQGNICTENKDPISCHYSSTGLNEISRQMINIADWNAGAPENTDKNTNETYAAEKNIDPITESFVGLLTVSDYVFSAEEATCSREDALSALTTCNSWLFDTQSKWLLTPGFYITADKTISKAEKTDIAHPVRPAVYLKSTIVMGSGMGTQENPYQIGLGFTLSE